MNSRCFYLYLSIIIPLNAYAETVENRIEQCVVTAAELNLTQQSLFMNLLYNMYMHAHHGEIVKERSYDLSRELIDIHNSFDPEEISNAIPKIVQETSILKLVAYEQKKHFVLWQLLDRYISEHDAQASDLLIDIQEFGQILIQSFITHNNDIETLLLIKKDHLEKNAQSNYTIAQTFELLRTHPEMFSSEKDLEKICRVDTLHGLNKSIEANIQKLSDINRDISGYIDSVQSIAIDFIGIIYEKTYAHLKEKNGCSHLLIITFSDDQQALKESDVLLPYPLKNK